MDVTHDEGNRCAAEPRGALRVGVARRKSFYNMGLRKISQPTMKRRRVGGHGGDDDEKPHG